MTGRRVDAAELTAAAAPAQATAVPAPAAVRDADRPAA